MKMDGKQVFEKNIRVAIVILNWNGSDDTISCITTIREWSHISPDIYVVDNNSLFTEKQKLRNHRHQFILIENKENEGFSEGCNIGIRAALAQKQEAILLLNNDAAIDEKDLMLLIDDLAKNPEVGVIGPLIYDPKSNQLINAGGKDIGWNYRTHIRTNPDKKEIYDVDYVSGTAMLVRVDVFNKIGFLDNRYFFSGEIADFCKRVRKFRGQNGFRYRVVIEPRAKAVHNIHDPSKDREKLYAYYTIRNRYIYVRKFLKPYLPILYPFWIYHHLKHALTCLKEKRGDVATVILKGIAHGLLGRKGRMI